MNAEQNGTGTGRQRGARHLFKPVVALVVFGLLGAADTCTSVTVFQSNFDADPIGGLPSTTQLTGTVTVLADPGMVTVVGPPANTTGQWVQISRPNSPGAAVETLRCNPTMTGRGTFSLTSTLYLPSGGGVASIGFNSRGPDAQFLHIGFLTDNTVRVNDSSSMVFGSFARDTPITVIVTLTITDTSAQADISLFGTATTGSFSLPLTPLVFAQQFANVDFFMGFPQSGSFLVSPIIITDVPPAPPAM